MTKALQHIEALRSKHAELDAHLVSEQQRPRPDTLTISRLKKLKLLYKQKIQQLEATLRPV